MRAIAWTVRLLFRPAATWRRIADEGGAGSEYHVLMILFALIAVAEIGAHATDQRDLDLTLLIPTITLAIVTQAAIVNWLAPRFGGSKAFNRSFLLVAFSYVPGVLALCFELIPQIGQLFSWIGAIYGFVLLYFGLAPMMRSDATRNSGYFLVAAALSLPTFVVAGAISATVDLVLGLLSGRYAPPPG